MGTRQLAVSFADVEMARSRIEGAIYKTPCAHSQMLSEASGNKVFLKLENLQMSGSFKERGSLNKLLTLSDDEKARGVITASAGNHSQGVSYHATRLGIDAKIVMPRYTPLIKVTRTRQFGATVELIGESFDDAYAAACKLGEEEKRTFVHPFDDPLIIAGQGTVGLELLEQNPYLDAVVVPVGGGGLIAGVAIAIKETNPRIKVFGVEAAALPGMKRSLEAGKVVEVSGPRTMADGIAVRRVGELTFQIVERYVDDIVVVDEEEISSAVLTLLEVEKTVVEGAGATPLAALLNDKLPLHDKKVALICSGGNIDVTFLNRIIERGLVKDGRMARFGVTVLDRPGSLTKMISIVSGHMANILEIGHNRAFSEAEIGETHVTLTVETRGHDHIETIVSSLDEAGFRVHMLGPVAHTQRRPGARDRFWLNA
jgi:threonine dehydratase